MTRKVNQVLWDQWRQRIERQRASGLSIAEFCRRENVPRQGFHVWRRKLRHATPSRHEPQEAARLQRSRKRRAMVTLRRQPRHALARPAVPPGPTNFLQLPVTAARPSPWTELALADGTVLRLPPQNIAALIAVLRVLRGEPCDLAHGERGHA
jgi:transposase-like protein